MPLIQSQCTFVKLPLGVVVAVAVLAFPVDAMAIAEVLAACLAKR